MRKISSIDKTGKVLFVDDKGTGTTIGTKTDCNAYGYDYNGRFCYAFKTQKDDNKDDNIVQGFGNSLSGKLHNVNGNGNEVLAGSNANILGSNNLVHANASNSVTVGKGNYTEHYGSFNYSASNTANRCKFMLLQLSGTTTNATPTELYIGGEVAQRFIINSDFESAYAIDYTAVGLNAASNEVWTNYGHATFKYVNSTLTEVGHTKATTIRDSALDYDIEFAAINGTEDYIEIKVEGEASHTVYWNVILKVTEVRV